MQKRIVKYIICLAVVLLTFMQANAFAQEEDIEVFVNGVQQTFDVAPKIIADRTFVPFRKIFEALDATVEWQADTRTVIGTKGDTVISLQIDSVNATVNKVAKTIDAPPTIENGRTLVPLRFISESLGLTVSWNGDTRIITIVGGEKSARTTGTLKYDTGVVKYEGQLLNGIPDGTGKEFYDSGKLWYEGAFLGGNWHGYGKFYYESGEIYYDGMVKLNALNGVGKIYYENGALLYDGEWANDQYNGVGKLYSDIGKLYYEGSFVNDLMDGFGKLYDEDGTVLFTGQFKNDLPAE
ncbi:MAG: hypothetical protein H7Y41_07780 [Hyphomonadaceae bacterium]|nr:hypothetical protein [Clostridia bacterium]